MSNNENIIKNNQKNVKKTNITQRNLINNFNFRQGDLFLRMGYLDLIANKTTKNKNDLLTSIYLTKVKKIKERNNLKIKNDYNNKICLKCSKLLISEKISNFGLFKIDGKMCLLIECWDCGYISKNIIN